MAQAQINARIDADLKAAGDAGLAVAGYTPSQAVRILWALAAKYRDSPGQLRRALEPDAAKPAEDERAERKRRLAAVRRATTLVEEFFREQGLEGAHDPMRDSMTDREYYDMLRSEHYREKGYLQ